MDMEVTANTDDADMVVSSQLNITSVIRVPCPSTMRQMSMAQTRVVLWPAVVQADARAVSLARLEMRCFPVMCDGAGCERKRASLSTITTTAASDQQRVR